MQLLGNAYVLHVGFAAAMLLMFHSAFLDVTVEVKQMMKGQLHGLPGCRQR